MQQVDWTVYSERYDLMAENNPAYQDLLNRWYNFLIKDLAMSTCRILDIGAGTGNFSLLSAQLLPMAQVTHLEPNVGMNSLACTKAQLRNLTNLTVCDQVIEQVDFPAEHFDIIISIHALYTMQQPQEQLRRIACWLRPEGWLFLCDLGRVMDVADWKAFLFEHLRKEKGLFKSLKLLWQGREIARQNRNINSLQVAGKYWLHSPEEFRIAVETAGFQIRHQALVYRGFSDLIIAQKK